jgi:hypothetical protein
MQSSCATGLLGIELTISASREASSTTPPITFYCHYIITN